MACWGYVWGLGPLRPLNPPMLKAIGSTRKVSYIRPLKKYFASHISVNEQFKVNASGFVVLMMFNIAHPQLAPDLSTDDAHSTRNRRYQTSPAVCNPPVSADNRLVQRLQSNVCPTRGRFPHVFSSVQRRNYRSDPREQMGQNQRRRVRLV